MSAQRPSVADVPRLGPRLAMPGRFAVSIQELTLWQVTDLRELLWYL